jgi:hypothetical protein
LPANHNEHLEASTESTLLENEDPPEIALLQQVSPPAPAPVATRPRTLTETLTRVATIAAGFALPGGGHFIQGRWGRGLVLGLSVMGMFLCGIFWMAGHLYVPRPDEWLTIFPFLANIGLGGVYIVCFLLRIGLAVNADAPTFEYGNTFVLVAGLLNFLVILDAYDLAIGRKK